MSRIENLQDFLTETRRKGFEMTPEEVVQLYDEYMADLRAHLVEQGWNLPEDLDDMVGAVQWALGLAEAVKEWTSSHKEGAEDDADPG